MAIFDPGYADLRRLLGIGGASNNNYFADLTGIGRNDLNDPAGYGGAYALWLAQLEKQNPGMARALRGQLGNVANKYRAAAAADPTLSFTGFLDAMGPEQASGMTSTLTPFERGENPRAYQGSYRLLKA